MYLNNSLESVPLLRRVPAYSVELITVGLFLLFLSFILNGHTVAPHEQAFEYFISAYTNDTL